MTTQPLTMPDEEEPITERTQALIDIQEKLNTATSQLQDVTREVREIRRMMNHGESWRAAAWRAITNFVGYMQAERKDHPADRDQRPGR